MKLTDEQIEQILAEAPDGAVFFDGDDYSDINGLVWDSCGKEYFDCGHFVCGDNLDLYREILYLRQRVQRWEGLNQEILDTWHCGDNDDLWSACGAIVDYLEEKDDE